MGMMCWTMEKIIPTIADCYLHFRLSNPRFDLNAPSCDREQVPHNVTTTSTMPLIRSISESQREGERTISLQAAHLSGPAQAVIRQSDFTQAPYSQTNLSFGRRPSINFDLLNRFLNFLINFNNLAFSCKVTVSRDSLNSLTGCCTNLTLFHFPPRFRDMPIP